MQIKGKSLKDTRIGLTMRQTGLGKFEWIEEEKESTLIMYGEIIESMANEIARHRYPKKYEYDDKLIEKIIEEFMEEK